MTFTKFNEFSYATPGALYMLSSHAQLALAVFVSAIFFYLVCGSPCSYIPSRKKENSGN